MRDSAAVINLLQQVIRRSHRVLQLDEEGRDLLVTIDDGCQIQRHVHDDHYAKLTRAGWEEGDEEEDAVFKARATFASLFAILTLYLQHR